MVRSKTLPAREWHVRVSSHLTEVRSALKDISGCCIGEHPEDSGCSRTHYHIWFEDSEVKSRDKFATYFKQLIRCNLNSNKDFAILNVTSFIDWYRYVYGPPDMLRIAWEIQFNKPESERPWPLNPPIIADPLNVVTTPNASVVALAATRVSKPSKKPMRVQFIEHLDKQGWIRENEFIHGEFNSETAIKKISEELTDFWHNAFTVPEGERMVRHALFEFSDLNLQKFLGRQNAKIFHQKIFPD